jgi:hypothetical protein
MRTVWKYVRPVGLWGAAVATSGLLAAACGGSSAPAPASSAAHVAKPSLDPAVVAANRTMAAGVPIGGATAPVETRFDLAAAPAPGEPFRVQVAVLPGAPAPLLRLDVTGTEGLLVLSPEVQITHEKVTAGSAVPLEIRAQSAEAGSRVLYVKATLELPDGPQARTFAFPILVGPPRAPAPAPAKAPPPAKAAR